MKFVAARPSPQGNYLPPLKRVSGSKLLNRLLNVDRIFLVAGVTV